MGNSDQDDHFKDGELPEDFMKDEDGSSIIIANNTTTTTTNDNNNSKKRKSDSPADETTTTDAEDGKAKLRARREANRIHAFKSRQRNKLLLHELQQTVAKLNQEKAGLERRNEVLMAQVEVLQKQNMVLLNNQQPALAFAALQQHSAALQQQIMGAATPTTNSSGTTVMPDLSALGGTGTTIPTTGILPEQQQLQQAPMQPLHTPEAQLQPQLQQQQADSIETLGDAMASSGNMIAPLQMMIPTPVAAPQQQQQPWLNAALQQQLQANPLFFALFLQQQQQQQQQAPGASIVVNQPIPAPHPEDEAESSPESAIV